MCQIYDYPKAEDLLVMESALDIFLQSRHGAVRDVMVSVLKVMLERYNVSKICLRWCIVCHGQQGGVQILPRETTRGEVCPGCGEKIHTPMLYGGKVSILSILEGPFGDVCTYGCGCGRIFGRWEENNGMAEK